MLKSIVDIKIAPVDHRVHLKDETRYGGGIHIAKSYDTPLGYIT